MLTSTLADSNSLDRVITEGEETLDDLLANPYNYDLFSRRPPDLLSNVLEGWGWRQRVIVNRQSGHIIDGCTYLEGAIASDEKVISAIYVDLDDAEECALIGALDWLRIMVGRDGPTLAFLRQAGESNEPLKGLLDALDAIDLSMEWQGMPEFTQDKINAWGAIRVNFLSATDRDGFAALIGQTITDQTHSIWYPKREIDHCTLNCYVSDES